MFGVEQAELHEASESVQASLKSLDEYGKPGSLCIVDRLKPGFILIDSKLLCAIVGCLKENDTGGDSSVLKSLTTRVTN
jgi:hypothetical protein